MTALPVEWSRGPQWVSEAARLEWEPVLFRASKAWGQMELASVSDKARPSALVAVTPAELVQAHGEVYAQRLQLTVVGTSGGELRTAVHRAGLGPLWHRAWTAQPQHHHVIGELLGYPSCCQEFFIDHWVTAGHRDVVPFMADVRGPWETNILLRWAGVRAIAHLPCTSTCEASLAMARTFLQVGDANGCDTEAIERVLRLPVKYESFQGVTIVETPHFRTMAGGVPPLVRRSRAGEPPSWEDNGFNTRGGMELAHLAVLRAAGPCSSALDLGAGDGTLLAAIAGGRVGRWVGVERDAMRVVRGRRRHPNVQLEHGLIQDWASGVGPFKGEPRPPFDVALLMPGRLLEMPLELAHDVRVQLRARARRLVAYAYGDVLRSRGGLAPLARAAGLQLVGETVETGPDAAASLAEVV